MLWFIRTRNGSTYQPFAFKYILCYGSSSHQPYQRTGPDRFKYILCYGSSLQILQKILLKQYLNTSYVMVHQTFGLKWDHIDLFKYILCYGSSRTLQRRYETLVEFKYILCYGSSMVGCFGLMYICTFKYILCYGSSLRLICTLCGR